MDTTVTASGRTCVNCNATIAVDSRFCNSCGSLQTETQTAATSQKWTWLKITALFYVLELGTCCLFKFVDALNTTISAMVCDAMLDITAIVFFCFYWQENRHLLKWSLFSFQKLCAYCAIAFSAALLVNYSVDWLHVVLFPKDDEFLRFWAQSWSGIIIVVLFDAVNPALFEELAFRGFMLQNLSRIIDIRQAAFITSFLFAIIHLSFLSLFWLIPFAFLLAYVRIKEQTLWYGVAMHFCFNLTACILKFL